MTHKELSTSDVAKLVGVTPDVLRKWKYRGFLKLAPQGVPGQGRSVECRWSEAAVEEAKAWARTWRPNRDTKKAPRRTRVALTRKEAGG